MPCAGGALLSEKLEPRPGLPPLLTNLGDRPPESLHYLGTSFGLTQDLLNFWRKGGFAPVYLRQNASDITGASPSSHQLLKEQAMETCRCKQQKEHVVISTAFPGFAGSFIMGPGSGILT